MDNRDQVESLGGPEQEVRVRLQGEAVGLREVFEAAAAMFLLEEGKLKMTEHEDNIKFYSIKYLAAKGIQEFMGHVYENGYATNSNSLSSGLYRFERIGKNAFTSREQAVTAAITAYRNKIKSSRKAVERLEKAMEALLAE